MAKQFGWPARCKNVMQLVKAGKVNITDGRHNICKKLHPYHALHDHS